MLAIDIITMCIILLMSTNFMFTLQEYCSLEHIPRALYADMVSLCTEVCTGCYFVLQAGKMNVPSCVAGKFDGELNLMIWLLMSTTVVVPVVHVQYNHFRSRKSIRTYIPIHNLLPVYNPLILQVVSQSAK